MPTRVRPVTSPASGASDMQQLFFLDGITELPRTARRTAELNKIEPRDRPAHDWYRFVLSYPPHLVRRYLEEFHLGRRHCVLDPFSGTGTTLVECQKAGVASVGIEANPMAHFAGQVKIDWSPDPQRLRSHSESVAHRLMAALEREGLSDDVDSLLSRREATANRAGLQRLPAEAEGLLLTECISPVPLHKTLRLLELLQSCRVAAWRDHQRLALASAVVNSISNLHFGPEVGVGPRKADAAVGAAWLEVVRRMSADIETLRELPYVATRPLHADSRDLAQCLEPRSVDAVITSPPYPNEKDYTRTTRLESVLLGFLSTKADLRRLKEGLIRSNTRNVFKGDVDDAHVGAHDEIQQIANRIEARRIELGKTSGFERLYSRVTRLYFGGMHRHLAELRAVLRPGARLAYVVGDQASYLRVMIRTGQLLADIAVSLGYRLVRIDLFRTRLATATREQLREEVVVLEWPGAPSRHGRKPRTKVAQ